MKSPSKTKETLEISLFTFYLSIVFFFSLSSFTCNAQNASTQFFSISNFYFTSFCSSLIIYELHFGRFIFFFAFRSLCFATVFNFPLSHCIFSLFKFSSSSSSYFANEITKIHTFHFQAWLVATKSTF